MKEKGALSQIFHKMAQPILDTKVGTAVSVFNVAGGTALTAMGMPYIGIPIVATGVIGLLPKNQKP